jgi:hypothetical protein
LRQSCAIRMGAELRGTILRIGCGMLPPCGIPLIVLWALLSASPQSQTAAPNPQSIPTFKAKARLVLLDIVVTNNKGEPVTGLKKEDFELFETGSRNRSLLLRSTKVRRPARPNCRLCLPMFIRTFR